MLVSLQAFDSVVKSLSTKTCLAVDTETTGLHWYMEDRLFSIIIADETESYYFNFSLNAPSEYILTREHLLNLKPIFEREDATFYLHNAKFDLHFLKKEGLTINGKIHDTEVVARIVYNEHMNYSLAEVASRIGLKKDDEVEKYISENGLYEWEQIPGQKNRKKRLLFHKVPFDIISKYARTDARITFDIAQHQSKTLSEIAAKIPESIPTPLNIVEMESKLSKVCFDMESRGFLIDRQYCEKALAYELAECEKIALQFKNLTNIEFHDARTTLVKAFTQAGALIPRTEKGNPCFDEDALKAMGGELSQCVLKYRAHFKRANSYYRNFLKYADKEGFIHANFRQAGTATGRFSVQNPALQTLNKEEDDSLEFKVRRSFIPDHGQVLVSIDYQALEYRLMADYAAEKQLIKRILQGEDVHSATAAMMGVDRKSAKTLNFLLLYGGGAGKLAAALGITLEDATRLKKRYFLALPQVETFIKRVCTKAQTQGIIRNAYGRRCYFSDPNFAYKAPNYLIQGTGGDTTKFAMIEIDKLLKNTQSRLLLSVHDEVVLSVSRHELDLVPKIKLLMEQAYPHRSLPLQCSVSYSLKSWGDMIEGMPESL